MKKPMVLITILLQSIMAYSLHPDTLQIPSTTDQHEWFDNGEWLQGLEIEPASSIDVQAFYSHFHNSTAVWNYVFRFLKESDLKELKPGKRFIAEHDLMIIVDEYTTQKMEKREYEAHRNYIDLQYVISGEELIGIAELSDFEVLQPYDQAKDIGFYHLKDGTLHQADSESFFIFFPHNAHKPCVQVKQPSEVKKIVFKIPVNGAN